MISPLECRTPGPVAASLLAHLGMVLPNLLKSLAPVGKALPNDSLLPSNSGGCPIIRSAFIIAKRHLHAWSPQFRLTNSLAI